MPLDGQKSIWVKRCDSRACTRIDIDERMPDHSGAVDHAGLRVTFNRDIIEPEKPRLLVLSNGGFVPLIPSPFLRHLEEGQQPYCPSRLMLVIS